MSETNPPQSDRVGDDYQRGPNPAPGGDIDTSESAVPPYDDRNRGRNERAESVARAIRGEPPMAETTQPESSAPTTGEGEMAPSGVGESITRRGEEVVSQEGKEAGRYDEGAQGQSGRPAGSSDERDSGGV